MYSAMPVLQSGSERPVDATNLSVLSTLKRGRGAAAGNWSDVIFCVVTLIPAA